MAPRIAKGKVIIGVSGGDRPTRGFFDGLRRDDRTSRLEVLHGPRRSVEAVRKRRDEEGRRHLGRRAGGRSAAAAPSGTAWPTTPDADLVYVGTGNAEPWPQQLRTTTPAKTISMSARFWRSDVDTGELKWHYQVVPGDIWDYDSVQHLMLADLTINGRPRKVIMQANKDGFYYVIDRLTGEFISAGPFSKVNWAKGIDPKTGRPIVNPEAYYGTEAITISPGGGGAHNWSPMSFNPVTGLTYIPTSTANSWTYQAEKTLQPETGPDDRHGSADAGRHAAVAAVDWPRAARRVRAARGAGRVGSGRAADALAHARRRRHRRRHDDDGGESGVSGDQRRTSHRVQRRQGREAAGACRPACAAAWDRRSRISSTASSTSR